LTDEKAFFEIAHFDLMPKQAPWRQKCLTGSVLGAEKRQYLAASL
jgi:hypothetical protein